MPGTSELVSTNHGARLHILSLGAGVQSTTLALMACRGEVLPNGDSMRVDAAIFADTRWEPVHVYQHLDRLTAELDRAGIPLYRVSKGDLRADTLDPRKRFVSVPYYTLAPNHTIRQPVTAPCPNRGCGWRDYDAESDPLGERTPADCADCGNAGYVVTGTIERPATRRELEGIGRRQCTAEYKLGPINRKVRELLGAAPPDYRRVPRGRVAEQWIGFSTDEVHRVNDRPENRYTRKRYPLLELGMSRKDCQRWLRAAGWPDVARSACIGCPYHGNRQWREMRDHRPREWADAVDFDRRIRQGGTRIGVGRLNGEAFLHRSRLPLELAPIDRVSSREWADRQIDIFDELAEYGDPDGCSPYGCRSGIEVA
ncbi:hypothetical protein IU500_07120 [Nocardia terpenica]|nr:hypothetical protein [Nocardia terpenica]MBF6103808.1 hypothetical protein [Nocardia terpenica]MBF6111818.1 hypothetical protein [Nocardia terpenica]MBF6118029.1 hypothetical protein [Nocardia terpenica]MBF6155245.1 hypothetical protein [Nocardia terpenica]